MNQKNIVITGGNRGIGNGLLKIFSEEHNVVITVRDKEKGEQAIQELKGLDNILDYVVMDVNSNEMILNGREEIKEKLGHVDLLINNAGIFIKEHNLQAIETSDETILKTFNTNTLGVLRMCKSIVPIMPNGGRIINVSSGMGQLDDMEGGFTAYRLSKTSLNSLTKILSKELSNLGIKVNTICPGWVRTDMGGDNATLSIKESASHIFAFALDDEFPNGQFLRHGKKIPW
ncbi:MAG: SDR family NAD(P)-dependent oxidoreductase [Candidatus Neomarinimicrobiota bacterium]|tara:strand:- start:1630 stop:2322 length:693 start_codon:yes stop_codon:yes gene_type:complete